MNDDSQKATVAQPPSPSSVLYFIYQKDGDGALSYEVENGSWTTYWYGYPFELDGKRYYTGFAYDTPFKFGKAEEESDPAPETKATITQSTFMLTAPGTESPWTFMGSDRSVGEFGAYEKGNEIDETRKPQSHRTPGGNLVLAIPTWYLASGTRVTSFDVFVFNPHELAKTDEQRWVYLGNVVAGEDNGAACDEDDGGKIACVKSSGTLSFVPQEGSDLPQLRIARSGTEIASPGKTRVLGPADATDYRYDAEKKQYQ
ncbi:MAG: hypothetical protein ACREO0_03315 [Pseudoxanthomonas sp.]